MILKNRKFILKTFKSAIPIDEDELVKVYEAISTGDVKILKKGWFNPSGFDSIIEDEEYMKTFRSDYRHQIRDGSVTEYPSYKDLFPELREEIKKVERALTTGKIGEAKKLL